MFHPVFVDGGIIVEQIHPARYLPTNESFSGNGVQEVAECAAGEDRALNRLMDGGAPFVMRGAAVHWPARTLLSWRNLKERHGSLQVEVRRMQSLQTTLHSSMRDYVQYVENTEDEDPFYLWNWPSRRVPELAGAYDVPSQFATWIENTAPGAIPQWSWLFIGPARAGSRAHIDIVLSSAWLALLHGTKSWTFSPPRQALEQGLIPAGVLRDAQLADAPSMTCLQRPGDIVLIPGGWLHEVVNLEASVAISENFVNAGNIATVISYLECTTRGHGPWTASARKILARLRARSSRTSLAAV